MSGHPRGVAGSLVRQPDGELAWEIEGLEQLDPFLISVVSAADHWLFVSTSGGLTAGRVSAARALFPYETDDRLHLAAGLTGPITLVRARGQVWQPFDERGLAPGRRRALRKAAMGHWVEFEESAPDLGLVFRYRWVTSERFGLVRRASIEGTGDIELLDGLLNVLPAGVHPQAQQSLSALVDAYKRTERVGATLGLFALEAHLSDRASPAEALRANVVWRLGLPDAELHLTARAVRAFRDGAALPPSGLQLGSRGAYLVRAPLALRGRVAWDLVGDVHLDHVDLAALQSQLDDPSAIAAALQADLAAGAEALRRNVASADGEQHTADNAATVHHFANVVFNNMRGGVFFDGHHVPGADLAAFVGERNRDVARRHGRWLAELPARLPHADLLERADAVGDPQLLRLCLEYLPLAFSRRHGDPSRPWNSFTIHLRHSDGSPVYNYEGNWRDIFQNWEALARSFPAFLPSMVAKFVNASTADGFNPYRITRAGIDWEEPNPADPWSNIGYWGDHQIVYLFRLLEATEATSPGLLAGWLARDLFSTADVPYRLRPYADLVVNAKDTIVFDHPAAARSAEAAAALGGDGRLVRDADGQVVLVNLLEKLVITVLAKLSNLVVDGGIWMNTQRPEWNDANNALVGAGLSVVTLAQLRRALVFLRALTAGAPAAPVAHPVAQWFAAVRGALDEEQGMLGAGPVAPVARRRLLDRLGIAFGTYRTVVYGAEVYRGSVDRTPLAGADVAALCAVALRYVDHTLETNRRSDGLFHSYNLLSLGPDDARVDPLYEMLEGQVAVIGSGWLSPRGAVAVIDAMYASALWRPDQQSFLLYPFRERPPFAERNRVPRAVVERTPGLEALVRADLHGVYHFHAELENGEAVSAALADAPPHVRAAARAAYEEVFDHHSFTGRSGTMYKYEGLGSIYWHMVSKLLVSVQEVFWSAVDEGTDPDVLAALSERYYRIRQGLSFNKSVAEYGAVPSDPYSHTPRHLGAQQPGMTGQVKEEILTRLGELGVRVRDGRLGFEPRLLRRRELLSSPAPHVAFTVAQTPVTLWVGGEPAVEVTFRDGRRERHLGAWLPRAESSAVLGRTGEVQSLAVTVAELELERPVREP